MSFVEGPVHDKLINLREYQEEASTTAVYPKPFDNPERNDIVYASELLQNAGKIIPVFYCALGLAGESGEVADQVKKSWRNNMILTPERVGNIADELGDVLWYAAQLSTELRLDLQVIAEANIMKLQGRKDKGELKHG